MMTKLSYSCRMSIRVFALAAAITTAISAPALAQGNADWRRPFPAFKLIGNVYWVGTYDLSTYLITTPQGHFLINTGFPDTVPQIAAGVEKLGFKMGDVRMLLATHAHGDHVAGLAELKRLTKARLAMMEPDAPLLEDGGRSDFRFGDETAMRFDPVTVDRRLKDRDTIVLGDVTVTAHHHPGHTKGATSFTFTVRENGRDYRVIIANMGSINPGVTVNGMPKYPTIGQDYAKTFAAQKALQIDVFLASHAAQFRMHEKYKPGDSYDPNRFVDPAGYRTAVERAEKTYVDQLAKERSAGPALAPTGTLRVAFLGTNPVHARVNAQTGAITGPVADLVAELAKRKGVPFKLIPAPDVRGVIARLESGEADAGVMAYEAARAREVDFAGGFAVMFNSYVVRTASPLKTVADADTRGPHSRRGAGTDAGDLPQRQPEAGQAPGVRDAAAGRRDAPAAGDGRAGRLRDEPAADRRRRQRRRRPTAGSDRQLRGRGAVLRREEGRYGARRRAQGLRRRRAPERLDEDRARPCEARRRRRRRPR